MSIIWIHEDAMSLDHPAISAAGPDASPVYIWDAAAHHARKYSLKRRVFIYECAHELEIPIYAGNPVEVLTTLADGDKIYLAHSPNPYVKEIVSTLRESHDVIIVEAQRLAHVPNDTDTARFFRFWNRAKKSALTHSSELTHEDVDA